MKYIIFLLPFLFLITACNNPRVATKINLEPAQVNIEMKGLNLVSPPRPFEDDPMTRITAIGSNWIAVIPFGFTRPGQAKVSFNSKRQWWGERYDGCEEIVRLAKGAGLKVMLKPQVWLPGSWPGGMDFETATEWESWEADYEAYILPMAELAEQKGVELFCIGTEFKMSVQKRAAFWEQLIEKIKTRYSGKLTYAANWDEYNLVSFWDKLDYVGIDAYFPLLPDETPQVKALTKAWAPTVNALDDFYAQVKRPIIFTEFGYLCVDGAAYNTWELEENMREHEHNEQAQANAYEALFAVFSAQSWWKGGFVWKWFPNIKAGEGKNYRDYTPQGKLAEEVLKRWYRYEE